MQEVVKLLAPLNATKLEGYAEGTDISMWMHAGVPGKAGYSRKWFFFFSFVIPATSKSNGLTLWLIFNNFLPVQKTRNYFLTDTWCRQINWVLSFL